VALPRFGDDDPNWYFTITGSPTTPENDADATAVILSGLTDSNGLLEDSNYRYESDSNVIGYVRKSTSAPYYKSTLLSGTITSTGFEVVAAMAPDE
jgi:hypothetical protein